MKKILKFPKGFLWGSATSAYQVEGGIKNNDWSKDFPAGRACDHYNRYEEDFDLLKKMHQNAYRFSIEWSRIEPEEGRFDKKEIEYYRKVLLALKKRQITPFVTLHHFTFPLWLTEKSKGLNKKLLYYFERYVGYIVEELGDLVDFWITMNEPVLGAVATNLLKMGLTQKRSLLRTILIIQAGIKAHNRAYQIIHSLNKKAKVGIAKNNIYFSPYNKNSFYDKLSALALSYFWNKYFLARVKNYLDFIGLNYYFHYRVKFPLLLKDGKGTTSDLGWKIYPKGIYKLLKELKEYQKPIYITENGVADSKDLLRADFIKEHLFWIHKAIQEGVKVEGYFYWSLIDNFEWKEGFEAKFGLIEVDFKTFQRKLRPSALIYAQVCKENALEVEI